MISETVLQLKREIIGQQERRKQLEERGRCSQHCTTFLNSKHAAATRCGRYGEVRFINLRRAREEERYSDLLQKIRNIDQSVLTLENTLRNFPKEAG